MEEFEVHSTLVNTSGLPSGVINHGIVTPQQYASLLAQSKVRMKTSSIFEENVPYSTNKPEPVDYMMLLNKFDASKLDSLLFRLVV